MGLYSAPELGLPRTPTPMGSYSALVPVHLPKSFQSSGSVRKVQVGVVHGGCERWWKSVWQVRLRNGGAAGFGHECQKEGERRGCHGTDGGATGYTQSCITGGPWRYVTSV